MRASANKLEKLAALPVSAQFLGRVLWTQFLLPSRLIRLPLLTESRR